MVYTEVKKRNKKRYYYRVISVRKGEKISKARKYLGVNLPREELSLKEKEADEKFGLINQKNFLKNRPLHPEGWSLIGDFSDSEIFWITGRNRQQQLQSKDWRFLTCIKNRKINIIEKLKPKIIKILKKYNIKRAGIFGSYACGEAKKNSD